MIAVDTNVLVRFIVVDDVAQAERVHALFETKPVFIGVTVILETEWVLRKTYGFDSARIVDAMRRVAGQSLVSIENARQVAEALRCVEAGMDFADAMHLALANDVNGFATFDKALIRKAAALGIPDVIEP